MKKKLVTAVTAASLLATVFGSSVLAARPVAASQPKAAYTTITPGADFDAYATGKYTMQSSVANKAATTDAASVVVKFFTDGASGVGTVNKELVKADLRASSSNSNVLVLWDDADVTCDSIDGATSNFAQTDFVTEVDDLAAAAGTYRLCIVAKTATTAASANITISAAASGTGAYAVMKTLPVVVVGPLASLTLSIADGYRYVANDNTDLARKLKLVGKDANGTILNGESDSPSSIDLLDAAGVTTIEADTDANSTDYADGAVEFFDDTTVDNFTTPADVDALQAYTLLEDTCKSNPDTDSSGDEGSSLSLRVITTGLTNNIASNAITVSCTLGEASRISAVAAGVTTGVGIDPEDADEAPLVWDIVASVVDEDGRPMGDGGNGVTGIDFGVVSFPIGAAALNLNDDEGTVAVGGKVKLADAAPAALTRYGSYNYSVKVTDYDLATTTAVAKTYKFTYIATNPLTISRTLNKLATSATIKANLGEENGGDLVVFTVESSTGSVVAFTRVADDNGVATLVLARRNTTVYVQAGLKADYSATDKDFDSFDKATSILTVSYK